MDDLLLTMIIAGIALSGAYLETRYAWWRKCKDAEQRKNFRIKELYAASWSRQTPEVSPLGAVRQQPIANTRFESDTAITKRSCSDRYSSELHNERNIR